MSCVHTPTNLGQQTADSILGGLVIDVNIGAEELAENIHASLHVDGDFAGCAPFHKLLEDLWGTRQHVSVVVVRRLACLRLGLASTRTNYSCCAFLSRTFSARPWM